MVDADDEGRGPGDTTGPPPFDSMANLRALSDIQRRGLEAANLVVTRVVSQVERSGPIFGAEPPPRPADDRDGSPSDRSSNGSTGSNQSDGALSDLFGQYTALTSSLLGALLGGGATPAAPTDTHRANGAARLTAAPHAGTSEGSTETLTLTSAAPGGRSVGELWLHNRSGRATADVHLHSSDLRRHDGGAIAATAVHFEPEHLPELPDLTSRGIRMSVDLPSDAPPGTFRGIVLAANLPDLWLVVELEVRGAGAVGGADAPSPTTNSPTTNGTAPP